jgi:hypothetical protein
MDRNIEALSLWFLAYVVAFIVLSVDPWFCLIAKQINRIERSLWNYIDATLKRCRHISKTNKLQIFFT